MRLHDPAAGPRARRRRRRARAHPGLAARADGRGAAGQLPLQPLGPREHPLRPRSTPPTRRSRPPRGPRRSTRGSSPSPRATTRSSASAAAASRAASGSASASRARWCETRGSSSSTRRRAPSIRRPRPPSTPRSSASGATAPCIVRHPPARLGGPRRPHPGLRPRAAHRAGRRTPSCSRGDGLYAQLWHQQHGSAGEVEARLLSRVPIFRGLAPRRSATPGAARGHRALRRGRASSCARGSRATGSTS